MRRLAIAAIALAGLAAGGPWLVAGEGQRAASPVWTEVAWPFPVDEWGTGKAYRCDAAHCGAEVDVFLRSKIGFCNCITGVADDDELDRLSDFNLFGGKATPDGEGKAVPVGWMKGRSRSYALPGLFRRPAMLSVAFSNDCDALVATATADRSALARNEQGVIDFLNSGVVLAWAKAQLGL
jgi:hypothetical protein